MKQLQQEQLVRMSSIELWVARTSPEFQISSKEVDAQFASKVKFYPKGRVYYWPPPYQEFIFEFAKDFAIGTLSGLFAAWLYDKLQQQKQPTAHATELGYPALGGQPIQDRETIEKILRTILERKPD